MNACRTEINNCFLHCIKSKNCIEFHFISICIKVYVKKIISSFLPKYLIDLIRKNFKKLTKFYSCQPNPTLINSEQIYKNLETCPRKKYKNIKILQNIQN